MRPGDFSPGNHCQVIVESGYDLRFNEAGGFLPRKLEMTASSLHDSVLQ